MTSGAILGSWRLVAAADDGHVIQVPATPPVSIIFQGDDTAVVSTGLNAINLAVRYELGAFTAQFRLTTAVYDGISDPNHLAVLRLLDALAPSAGPSSTARNAYRIRGDQLTIRVSTGTLEFARAPSGSGWSTSST